MPVFTATATALLASTALAGSFIATNLLASGLAYGAGHLLGAFDVPEFDTSGSEDQGVDVRLAASTQNRLPTLYGEWMDRGRLVYAEVSSDKQNYHSVIALGEGPVDSIDKVFWNEYELTFDSNGVVTDAVAPDGTATSQYNGLITVQTYLGTATGNNSTYLEGLSDVWTSTDKMTNIVYAVVSIKYDRDAGVTSLQDIRFVGTSPVLNPADAIQNLLTNSRYGLGLSSSDINTASFAAARNYYNQMVNYVDTDGDTVQQTRHEVNGSLSSSNDIVNRIQSIGRGCNTELTWSDGQWGLFINKQDSATSFEFNTSNIIGNVQVVEPGLNSLFNRIELNYGRNSENNYQRAEAFVEASAAVLYPNELSRTQTLDLPLVATSQEAKRVGTLNINQARQQLTVSHTADATAMPLEAGDVVRYTDADYGWSSKLFRITSITEVNEESSLTYRITAVEYADAIYNFVVNEDDVAPNVPENDVAVIEAVDDLAVSGQFPNRSVPAIQLTWTVPDNSLIETFDIFFSVGGTQFDSASTVYAKSTIPTGGTYTSGNTVTEEVPGIPTGNITFWVVGRNDFVRSAESNGVTVANYQPNPTINAETVYRFNETPSVISGVNIDVGAPPATETAIGTGRNNNANDTGWYESELDASDRENAPVWTAVTTKNRDNASPRELDFEFSGTSGDTIITQTPTNQIIDFELAGNIGDRELQYAARPEITQFTFSGQAAEADSVDPGLQEVWQIDVTGSTSGQQTPTNEEFYLLPAGTSNEIVQTVATFTFTPSGNTSDGVGDPAVVTLTPSGNTSDGLSPLANFNGTDTFIFSGSSQTSDPGFQIVNKAGNAFLTSLTSTNSTDFGNLRLNGLTSAERSTLVTALVATPNKEIIISVNSVEFLIDGYGSTVNTSGQLQIDVSSATVTYSGTGSIPTNQSGISLQYRTGNTIVSSSVVLTLDSDSNTYALANNLSGAVAIGVALNTAIGTDYDTDWTKTLNSSTGVITFTANNVSARTSNISIVQGSNGTLAVALVDTPVSLPVASSVSMTLDSTSNTYTLADNLSGGVAIGTALNTAIGTDFTGFTKVLDAATGAITFTADDFDAHTGSSSVVQGTNGTITIVDTNTPEVNTGTLTTLQLQVSELTLDQTITLESNVTGQDLLDDIETKLLANTAITNQFTVSQDTATIDGNSVTIVKLVAIPIQNLSLAITINSGITGTTSGTLVDGQVSQTATSITLTYDPDILPVTQMLTFGENATSVQVATELTALIDGHGDLEAVQGDTFTEVREIVSFEPPTAAQLALLDASTSISSVTNSIGNSLPSPTKSPRSNPQVANPPVQTVNAFLYNPSSSDPVVSLTEIIGKTILIVNTTNLFSGGWGMYRVTSVVTGVVDDYTFGLQFLNGIGRIASSFMNSTAYFNANGDLDEVLSIFDGNIKPTSTTFIEDLSSNSILVKADVVDIQTEPVITVNTQGTGDAAFVVSTQLEGRGLVPGAPAFTGYVVDYDGVELSRKFVASANSSFQSAIQIAADINDSTELTATVSGSVITVTSTANSAADTTISITTGTNEPGKTSTNDLAVSRAVTNFGSATDVFGGTDSTVTVRVSGEVFYTTTYNATDDTIPTILDDLEIGIDEEPPGFDLDERWDGDVQDDTTIRATALGLGTDPTITISIAAGSTATVDSIGNITTTPATLSSTRTVINPGEQQDVTSGELSTFTVVQGTTTLIDTMSITGASSASSVVTQIASAISSIAASDYTTSASDVNLLATLIMNGTTPDLTITVVAGANADDSAADLAVMKTVNQEGDIGTLDLTDADWTYFISSPTTDGDTTMITGDGTIAVRRGLFLGSLATSDLGEGNNTEVIFETDFYTTASEPSVLDVTGTLHVQTGVTLAAAATDVTFIAGEFQYTDDVSDLANATWTTPTSGVSSPFTLNYTDSSDPRVGTQHSVGLTFAVNDISGLARNTQFAFRMLLRATQSGGFITVPVQVHNGLTGDFLLQEILTV